MAKKFVSLDRLATFLDQIKTLLSDKVNTSDIINKTQADLEASWKASEVPDVLDLLDTSKFVPYSGATGDIDLGENSLSTTTAITVGEPTSSSNAATKNYVDSQWTTVHSW